VSSSSSRVASGYGHPSISAQMSARNTPAPASANAIAVARPMPRAAPVMNTVSGKVRSLSRSVGVVARPATERMISSEALKDHRDRHRSIVTNEAGGDGALAATSRKRLAHRVVEARARPG